MTRRLAVVIVAFAVWSASFGAMLRAQTAAEKVPIVAVSGCLEERTPNSWTLSRATEPTPSIANGPPPNAPVTGPMKGKNEFVLVGVSEFDLPSHKGHTVLVKALLIKAAPISRLNVTSVTHLAPTCPPAPK
jgi:hypothetical protein